MSSSDFEKECLDGVNSHYKKIHVKQYFGSCFDDMLLGLMPINDFYNLCLDSSSADNILQTSY